MRVALTVMLKLTMVYCILEALDVEGTPGEERSADEQWQARLANHAKYETSIVVPRGAPQQGAVISPRRASNSHPGIGNIKDSFVCREYMSDAPHRSDMFVATGSSVTSRLIDFVAVIHNVSTFTTDLQSLEGRRFIASLLRSGEPCV